MTERKLIFCRPLGGISPLSDRASRNNGDVRRLSGYEETKATRKIGDRLASNSFGHGLRRALILLLYFLFLVSCNWIDNEIKGTMGPVPLPPPEAPIIYSPSGASLQINSGSLWTNSLSVILNPFAEYATLMSVHNSLGDCMTNNSWINYSTSLSYNLDNSNAVNSIYLRYKSSSDVVSDCVSASIKHDDQPPTLPIELNLSKLSLLSLTESPIFSFNDGSDTSGSSLTYEVQLYRKSDGGIVVPWTSISSGSQLNGLTLLSEEEYYAELQTLDEAGNYSLTPLRSRAWTDQAIPRVINSGGFSRIEEINAVDFDADGDLDLVFAAENSNQVGWFINDGFGNFSIVNIATINGARGLDVADIDGDGDMDILVGSSDKVYWIENTGSGYTVHLINSGLYFYKLKIADLDGDGYQDFVVSRGGSPYGFTWYKNDGAENFTLNQVTGSVRSWNILVSDLDQDGDRDVLTSSSGHNTITWYENDGSQNFSEHVVGTELSETFGLASIDLDGDGDLDLIATGGSNDRLAWYENDGAETFTYRLISNAMDGPGVFLANDLDQDGDIDLVITCGTSDKMYWLENDGNENFTLHFISSLVDGRLTSGDFDGDGRLDIVGATFGGSIPENVIFLFKLNF